MFFLNLCKLFATVIIASNDRNGSHRAKYVLAKRVWLLSFLEIKLILVLNIVATSVFLIYRAYFSKQVKPTSVFNTVLIE